MQKVFLDWFHIFWRWRCVYQQVQCTMYTYTNRPILFHNKNVLFASRIERYIVIAGQFAVIFCKIKSLTTFRCGDQQAQGWAGGRRRWSATSRPTTPATTTTTTTGTRTSSQNFRKRQVPSFCKSFQEFQGVSANAQKLCSLRITQVRALERQNAALRQSTPHNEVEEKERDHVEKVEQENNAIMEGRCNCHQSCFFFFPTIHVGKSEFLFESPAKWARICHCRPDWYHCLRCESSFAFATLIGLVEEIKVQVCSYMVEGSEFITEPNLTQFTFPAWSTSTGWTGARATGCAGNQDWSVAHFSSSQIGYVGLVKIGQ